MKEQEQLLEENIREFYTQGEESLTKQKYNAAVSLFFKALAVLADWHLLKTKGRIPKSHSERFRILEEKYPELYELLDKDFPVYQDSYQIKISKEIAVVLENDVRTVAQKVGFSL